MNVRRDLKLLDVAREDWKGVPESKIDVAHFLIAPHPNRIREPHTVSGEVESDVNIRASLNSQRHDERPRIIGREPRILFNDEHVSVVTWAGLDPLLFKRTKLDLRRVSEEKVIVALVFEPAPVIVEAGDSNFPKRGRIGILVVEAGEARASVEEMCVVEEEVAYRRRTPEGFDGRILVEIDGDRALVEEFPHYRLNETRVECFSSIGVEDGGLVDFGVDWQCRQKTCTECNGEEQFFHDWISVVSDVSGSCV